MLEFQNWLESGYNTATIIWDAYKLDCIKDQKTPSAEDLLNSMKQYVAASNEAQKEKENTLPQAAATVDIQNENVTPQTIMEFAVKQKWLLGRTLISDAVHDENLNQDAIPNAANIPHTVQENLFNCCEELELLGRDFSNDEGQDSTVASGARIECETEHPDYLIQQGMKKTALK